MASSAQRLSASLWSARGVSLTRRRTALRAQRLSASLWSAPYGEEHGGLRRESSAQRLSASLWSAPATVLTASCSRCVLNAFRRHCGLHLRGAEKFEPSKLCSTPFGVTVVCTPQFLDLVVTQALCSTPFGVTVVCTGGALLTPAPTAGAQRLSASLWSAPDRRGNRPPGQHVLNAFRRHCGLHPTLRPELSLEGRCSTPFGVTVVCTSPDNGFSSQSTSAQRLSASLWSAPLRNTPHGCQADVLNAFRRHCGLHGLTLLGDEWSSECSTPFGVTVVCTRLASRTGPTHQSVLNAFRRHCGLHAVPSNA